MRKFFVTGTDTEVGKTYVSSLLLEQFNKQGLSTIGLKPIASGAELISGQLQNEDALILQKKASIELPYQAINPFVFAPPIAPHIAAEKSGKTLSVAKMIDHVNSISAKNPDVLLIEGAGGWYVPLNENETLADFVKTYGCSVIMVVGMRLGCINHSLLTYEAIKNSGVAIEGWVANFIDPDMCSRYENLETLKKLLPIKLLHEVPYIR